MSGHSKWANIKNKKAKTDSQKAVVFQKYSRELIVAARLGGADPAGNFRLRTAIEKAKAAGLPNDNIKRAIDKGAGAGAADNYEELTYEGYAAGGVAVVLEAMTDNRNRTAGEVRHYFDKFGGNMGTPGCVGFMFSKKGVLVIEREDLDKDEDTVMEDALEAGASDFEADEDIFTIYTEPEDFGAIRDDLSGKGYEFASAEVEQVPSTYTKLEDEETKTKMQKMLDMFEDNDDIQNVWHNWEMD